jgi:hypothetical protein
LAGCYFGGPAASLSFTTSLPKGFSECVGRLCAASKMTQPAPTRWWRRAHRFDFDPPVLIFASMSSVMRELRRRVRAEQSPLRFTQIGCFAAGRARVNSQIKHDGFRILAHRREPTVRLLSRNGNNLTDRFPLAAAAVLALPVRSCVVDGEAIVCDDEGHRLASLLRLSHEGIPLNEHFTGDGAAIYRHACALGCEGIVSMRLGSPYRAGRSPRCSRSKTLQRRQYDDLMKKTGADPSRRPHSRKPTDDTILQHLGFSKGHHCTSRLLKKA